MSSILSKHLTIYRRWSHAALADWLERGDSVLEVVEGVASDGAPYQIECNIFWDGKAGEDVRVAGDLSAQPQRRILGLGFVPDAVDDFNMRPDGSFVGEPE